jgi:hypothetical protein
VLTVDSRGVIRSVSSASISSSGGGGSGDGADPAATYVVISATGSLSNERVLTAGTGISIGDGGAGGNVTISTTGAPPTGSAGGDLTGSYPDPTLKTITTAATSGSASVVPVVTVDAKGRVTGMSSANIAISQSAVANLTTDLSSKLALTGGTMTGNLNISAGNQLFLQGVGNLRLGVGFSVGNFSNANAVVEFKPSTSSRFTFLDNVNGALKNPVLALCNLNGAGKGMALFADSNSSAFIYSDNGNFDITSDTKARIEASTFGLGTLRFRVDNSGSAYVTNKMYVGGTVVPTALIHLKAGTSTATTSPLKFTSGSLLATPESGSVEFNGDKLYLTITSSSSRKEIALSEGLTSGRVPFATTNGRLTDNANLTYNTTNLMLMSGSFMTSPTSGVTASISVFGSGTVGGSTYLDFMRVTNASSEARTPAKTFRVDNSGSLEIVNNAYNQVLLSLTDNGNLSVNGTTAATVVSNDATSGSLRFNNNNSQIYDDGNLHIHSRGTGQSLWINANSGSIIIGNQSPVSGGAAATAITMGSSTTATAYVSMYGSKTYTIGSYGYVFAGGAGGPLGGTTAPFTLFCDNRIQCSELDATSDERLKDIQGEIPLQEAIDLVNNVKPIKFTWKDGEDKGLKTGFSAQQTHKAGFDHLVGAIKNEKVKEEIDEDGFVSPDQVQLTIAYDQVIPYHTAVIKHLLEKIEKLEQTVAELQAKNK